MNISLSNLQQRIGWNKLQRLSDYRVCFINLTWRSIQNIIEAMVASVLDYGAPMWSHSVSPNTLERLQQHACRCFLGVGRKHALAALAGDMCWMPTSRRHQLHTIMFWISITQLNDNRIAKRYIKLLKSLQIQLELKTGLIE